jgi:hypothetical protein
MRRLTILLLLLSAFPLAVVMPYAATRLINLASGPSAADLHHADGSVSHMILDPGLKPPSWLRFPPGTSVVDASMTTWNTKPDIYTGFDVTIPLTLPAVKRYFVDALTAEGFVVTDHGLGTLNQKEADYLGVAGVMTGIRAATGDDVTIHFNEEEGLFRKVRQVQVGWHRGPKPATDK